MLTKKQKELFDYLSNYIAKNSISPSFEEMKNAVNLKSKSGIHRLITSLEQRGFIKRLKHKARAMEITKTLTNNFNNINHDKKLNSFEIPLLGSIEVISKRCFLAPRSLPSSRKAYLLIIERVVFTSSGCMNNNKCQCGVPS